MDIIKNFKRYKNNESLKWYKGNKKFEIDDSKEIPQYDDFINDDNFRQFLIEHGVYEEYLEHCKEKYRVNHKASPDIIDISLSWSSTPSKSVVWRNLYYRWREKYEGLYGLDEAIKWYKGNKKFEIDNSKEIPEYDDFINDDNFRQFLIDHDAYEEYIECCDDRLKKNHNARPGIVDASFTWFNTPSGDNFWRELNNLWNEKYKKLYGVDEAIKWYKGDKKFEIDDSKEIPEYDDFINDDNFRQFLIDHDAYEEYIECCEEINKKNPIKITNDIIGRSLTWFGTPSGPVFWNNLHNLWNEKYKELYGVDEAIKWYKGNKKFEIDDSKEIPEYDDFINDDNFRQFLIDHDAYEEYLKYCHVKKNHKATPGIVDASFTWYNTPSGDNFWRELNVLWNEKYKELYGVDEAIKWYKGNKKFEIDDSKEIPEYDDFINDDNFRQFLIDHDAYEEYLKYCKESFRKNHEAGKYIVTQSLRWSTTSSGDYFWESLHNLWQKKYEKLYGIDESVK